MTQANDAEIPGQRGPTGSDGFGVVAMGRPALALALADLMERLVARIFRKEQ